MGLDLVYHQTSVFNNELLVGLSDTLKCRWKLDNNKFINEASTEIGVAGFFVFRDYYTQLKETLEPSPFILSKIAEISLTRVTKHLEFMTKQKSRSSGSKGNKKTVVGLSQCRLSAATGARVVVPGGREGRGNLEVALTRQRPLTGSAENSSSNCCSTSNRNLAK